MRLWLLAMACSLACVHEQAPHVVTAPPAQTTAAPQEAPHPSQYVLGDGGTSTSVIRLDAPDSFGGIVGGVRVVQDGKLLRVASQETVPPLVAPIRLPPSLGGGFLFRSKDALFSSKTFDGPLKPLVSFATDISDATIGPGYVLVHLDDGGRVGIDPETGARAALSPAGLVDVAALDDGRAAALTTFGNALVSTDGGKQWSDVTSQLAATPASVVIVGTELWITSSGQAGRVETTGRLTLFDDAPTTPPIPIRPKDPRWKDPTPPLKRAMRSGVLMDDGTVVVVTQGTVARVDATTGAIVSMAGAPRLPPEADCEGVRTEGDVLFVCRSNGDSFVASHGLGDALAIEQSFMAPGVFYASDDGALAFGGPCTGNTASDLTVCVRGPGGTWQEHQPQPPAGDGGAPVIPSVDRWVPRSDGNATGLVLSNPPAMVDARTGEITALAPDILKLVAATPRKGRGKSYRGVGAGHLDRTWSTSGGSLRGWTATGTVIEIGSDGTVIPSPYAFDSAATWGPFAFAQSAGAAWQSTDRGQHWVEVMPPPHSQASATGAVELCNAVGCDLGGFYRLGWEAIPPPPAHDPQDPLRAPKLPLTRLQAIACSPLGTQKLKSVSRNTSSDNNNDLGLGAVRFSRKNDTEYEYTHDPWARVVVLPMRSAMDGTIEGVNDAEPALRALITGYATTQADDGTLKASGPVGTLSLLRRQASFLAPFDPLGTIRRGSLAMSDVLAVLRTTGQTTTADMPEPMMLQSVVPVLTPDGASVGDLIFGFQSGVLTLMRSTVQTRVAIQIDKQESSAIMGAATVGDDVVLLEGDEDGGEHVLRWAGSSIASAFDIPAPATSSLYPPNPDALAIGPHLEVGVLRTPSGAEPPSKDDPALVYLPGQQPTPLAPWSTLALADDPACKADTAGWHVLVTTSKPWVRGATADLDLTSFPSQTFVRVRWSATRACLEGLEVRTTATKTKVMQVDDPNDPASRAYPAEVTLGNWLVWKVLGSAASPAGAARIAVGAGVDATQPMRCSL